MDEKDYTSNEESYARHFYKKLSDERDMASRFGGRYPCSRTGNKVFFDCLGIETTFLFREPDSKKLKLTLEMSIKNDGSKKVTVETSQYLSDESGGGMLSEKMIDIILDGFFVPALKDFYRMKN